MKIEGFLNWAIRSLMVLLAATILIVFSVATPDVSALTIVRDYIGGAPPAETVGGGNLIDIFGAAADRWEGAILDPYTVTFHFGWAPIGERGGHFLNAQGGSPNREIEGMILFSNSLGYRLFLDPTPTVNEEYTTFQQFSKDLGGGVINTGRVYSNPVSAFVQTQDLLSVALHEIGHGLGLGVANNSFLAESSDGFIDVTAPRPFPNTNIPLVSNLFGFTSHIAVEGAVMLDVNWDERRVLSAADILVNAEISKFNNLNLDPTQPVPEVNTMLLLGSGFIGVVGFKIKFKK